MARRRRQAALSALLLVAPTTNATTVTQQQEDTRRVAREGGGGPRHRRRYRRPPSSAAVGTISDDTDHPRRHRLAAKCKGNQRSFVLNFQTDSYGIETSWFLRNDDTSTQVGAGPPINVTYGDFALYSASYCLDIGSTYTLAMEDDFGDGMCCARGHGGYEYSIAGVLVYTTNLLRTFADYVEHTFTVMESYTASPTLMPTTKEEGGVIVECVADPSTCGCDDIQQVDYRGNVNETESGLKCQSWSEQTPHAHFWTSEKFPDAGLSNNNHCRSPDGGWPWCLTTDPNVKWEYCRIPSCKTVERPSTIAPAMGSLAPVLIPTISPSTSPTYIPTKPPTPRPTPDYSVYNPANGCSGGDAKVKVEVRADEFSTDTSWELISPDGSVLMSRAAGSYGEYEYTMNEMCVAHGEHTFIIYDAYGDGMCCRYGDGFFRIHVDGQEVINGGSYNANVTAIINVGYDSTGWMTERDAQFLEAHNIRRKEFHERYNLTYIPLLHSPGLAASSKAWAEELLYACEVVGIEHMDDNPFGENLAKNTGNPETWGQLYHPDKIVGRWVDMEIGLPYPSNGHMTQAIWRASKYVGCGEAVRDFRSGVCRIQVCRYGRAGNCDMTRFNATDAQNWLEPMLLNNTRCGPDCPPEGCYHGPDMLTDESEWIFVPK